MKKILIFITIMLLLPVVTKADMGAPMIPDYDATVTNEAGAKCHEYGEETSKVIKTLDANTTFKASFEMDGMVYSEKNNCYVSVKDIKASKDVFDLEKSVASGVTRKLDKKAAIVVISRDLPIYNGPSEAYSKTDTIIKKGTKLSTQYVQDVWVYVEYKGTNGWIQFSDRSLGIKYADKETKSYIVGRDADVKDTAGNVVFSYKANEVIKDYYQTDDWSPGIYVEKDGKAGLLDSAYLVIYYESDKVEALEDFTLYETASKDSKVLGTINKGDKVTRHFSGIDTEYNGMWIYVEGTNFKGWIYESFPQGEEEAKETLKQIGDYYVDKAYTKDNSNISTEVVEPTTPSGDKPAPSNNPTPKDTIIYCVGGAIILALVVFVVILLVNKKKEPKENE